LIDKRVLRFCGVLLTLDIRHRISNLIKIPLFIADLFENNNEKALFHYLEQSLLLNLIILIRKIIVIIFNEN